MLTLKNNLLEISIKTIGAELCQIKSTKNNTNFMWNANQEIWANFAPNLFPIVGALKDGSYIFNNKKYSIPKHGFIRYNKDIKCIKETENSLTFLLQNNKNTEVNYPFKFNYYVIYTIENNELTITYKVENTDTKTIYFSVGGHPAFKCPVFKNEKYSDYNLIFEQDEISETYLLDQESGLLSSKTKPIFTTKNSINLTPDLFNNDALIFKDLKSKQITLNSNKNGPVLTIKYKDYNYFGIWAKPKANFICLEPWLGVTDYKNTNQELKNKDGIIKLSANKSFSASYKIEIHQAHLV
ncbi:aldose 1-epimerase family protein [Aurantibacter sp.]|uniref:aldose 1-epimerase family protein n=1 Tax=Aurantibacter sp. TaxID=2807103 RepID=UPI0035C87713